MLKCLCGELMRSVCNTCPNCGRIYLDNVPFIARINKLELALSLISDTQTGVLEAERVARTCLANNASLADITKELEKEENPAAFHLALILGNLAT